tara:strand:+ start:161 stop:337 length:177 start_codon:yes stop_codon:yes gene_type:complete
MFFEYNKYYLSVILERLRDRIHWLLKDHSLGALKRSCFLTFIQKNDYDRFEEIKKFED